MIFVNMRTPTGMTRAEVAALAMNNQCVLHTWIEPKTDVHCSVIIAATKEEDAEKLIDAFYGDQRDSLEKYVVDDPENSLVVHRGDYVAEVGTILPGDQIIISGGDVAISRGEDVPCCLIQIGGQGNYATAYLTDGQVQNLICGLRGFLEAPNG